MHLCECVLSPGGSSPSSAWKALHDRLEDGSEDNPPMCSSNIGPVRPLTEAVSSTKSYSGPSP